MQALKGFLVTPRNGRVGMEGLKGQDKSTPKEIDFRQRVPTGRNEMVKGKNNVNGGKGKRTETN